MTLRGVLELRKGARVPAHGLLVLLGPDPSGQELRIGWELRAANGQARGTIFGVPIIRIIVSWGLYWGILSWGNYHVRYVVASCLGLGKVYGHRIWLSNAG